MKRLSARLLALGLVVCSVPSNVYAASPTPIVIVKEGSTETQTEIENGESGAVENEGQENGTEEPEEDDINALVEQLKTVKSQGLSLYMQVYTNTEISELVETLRAAVDAAGSISAANGKEVVQQHIKAIQDAIDAVNQALGSDEEGPLDVIESSLKVHYSFEGLGEDAREITNLAKGEGDAALEEWNGILHEDSLKVVDEELAGKALQFTSNNAEYLQIPGIMQLDGSYTVGLWVKFDATQMSSSRSDDLILVQPKAADSNDGRTHLMVTRQNKLATYMDKTTREVADALGGFDRWQHVLISYDSEAGKVSMYENGSSVYEESVNKENVITSLTDLYFGRHKTAGNGSFQGYMDEIVVYNAALTAEQVDALYKENASRRSWPDLAAMIAQAEELLEEAELPESAEETQRLVRILGWIEEENITKDSSYDLIGQYITSMAYGLEEYEKAVAAPQAPKDLAATSDNAKKEVTLTWTAADGRVTAYEYSDDNGTTWKAAGTETTFKVTGLDYDKEYSFQVRAKNGEKAGAASNTVKVTLTAPAEKPAKPTGLQVQAGDKEVIVSWTAVEGATKYKVQKNGDTTWTEVTGTSHKFTGLTNDTTYTFSVKVVKDGQESDAATITGKPQAPSQPELPMGVANLKAEAGDGQVTLTWDKLAETVTKYQVSASLDTTENWVDASSDSSHTFTGLENDKEYTFKVRAVNANGSGAARSVKATPTAAVQQTVATPSITPATGTYTEAQDVTITCATQGAKIYYTTDGSTPTTSSTLYAGKITVSETTTIKAIAVKEDMKNSEVVSVTITINADDSGDPVETKVATPAFSKAAGTFTSTQKVAITTTTEGAKIYYSTNGSTPTTNSTEYKGEITVDKSMLIKAIAVKDGLDSSDVVSIRYEMEKEWIFTDVSSKDGWRYNAAKYTYNAGIMGENGTGSKKFDTELNLTRAMFVTVLYRMAGEPTITFEDKFPDVKAGTYYANAVIWANKNGIVDGKPDGTFGHGLNITRAEIAKMLKGYAAYCGFDVSAVKDLNAFSDGAAVIKSTWKKEALQWATAVEMITGKTKDGKTNLAADDYATRVECAQMIRKFAIKYLEYVE